MKQLWILLLPILFACSVNRYSLSIPANDAIELSYREDSRVDMRNASEGEVAVAVFDKMNNDQTIGFGLTKGSWESAWLGTNNALQLKNPSDQTVKIKFKVSGIGDELKSEKEKPAAIDFVLQNSSESSIPLAIPGVMNPNLSPNSHSMVSLEPGQEIFYTMGKTRELIITVSESIAVGDTIDVAKLVN